MELPKSQKKTARLLIDRALQRECRQYLQRIEQLLQHANNENTTPHDIYLKLYKETYYFDKHIAQRYDNMSGSRYFPTIVSLFCSDVLTLEDISLFSEEVQEAIVRTKHLLNGTEGNRSAS